MTSIRSTDGSRAADLLTRLDSAYLQFAGELPSPLRGLASERGTFAGTSAAEPFEVPSTMNPGITCTPWLFWELTRDVEDEAFLEVALGGILIVLASVVLDHLVDGQSARPGEASLLHQALYEGGAARLRATLPADSGFWAHFERLGREHIVGLGAELDSRANPGRLTFDDFVRAVSGKFSLVVVPMAAFVAVLGRGDLLGSIEASIKRLAVGCQLLDDVGDWQDDIAAGRPTYYMTRLAPPDAWRAPVDPSVEEIQGRIDAGWLDIKHMVVVQEWMGNAAESASSLGCTGWMEYVDGYRTLADEHMARFKARHLLRVLGPIVEEEGH